MILEDYEAENLIELNNETVLLKLNILPSEWYERKKPLMPTSAAIPGYVKFSNSPFWREPLDCVSPFHPAKDITIMGPAQMGKTFMVLEPAIGYTIEQNPGNILHLTGNSELAPDASLRIDGMIDNCKIRYLIKSAAQKLRNNKTGDTVLRKEFPLGIYRLNSITKKNALRQNDIYFLIVDDMDAAKKIESKIGSPRLAAKGRTKAFEHKAKRVWTSSPETKGSSLIEECYELSDKRLYYIPCPCCHEFIVLEWSVEVDAKNSAGITYKFDSLGRVDPKTIGYICQKCAGHFTEQYKLKWLNEGVWRPSCEPQELDHYGYKINGLYAAPGMTGWFSLAERWLQCNPPGQSRIEHQYQTWINIDIGDLYEVPTDEIKATELMKRQRSYDIGVIPESVSEKDGNGDIIFLTLAADMNGKLNDARIDWELRAWSRNGPTYSVKYGSIGTFIPNQNVLEKEKTSRELWTYEMNRPNSVWLELDKILGNVWQTDTGRQMKIYITGLDTGYLTEHIFNYIDRSQYSIIGLMGDKEKEYVAYQPNLPIFSKSTSRNNLFMVNVNMVKDNIAGIMRLPWDKSVDSSQPHQYMNFPYDGVHYEKFYSHYESESKRENDKGKFLWQKKGPTSQNHQFDCCVYQFAIKEIFLWMGFNKINKSGSWTWQDYAKMCPVRKK